jgi:hypothetical protein
MIELCARSQVLHTRRWSTKQVQELKLQAKKYLIMYPATAKYAKEPFLTYAVYAAVALALMIVWLTFTALLGKGQDTASCV